MTSEAIPSVSFNAVFQNERTGEERIFRFTLEEYLKAREWMETEEESISQIELDLNSLEKSRQAAYCAVLVWREALFKAGLQPL